MKKILVLTRFVKEYEPVRLTEEGRNLGFSVDLVKYGQISLSVSQNRPVIDLRGKGNLKDYDLIIPRAASKKGSSMVTVKTAVLQSVKENKNTKIINGLSFANYPLLGKVEQSLLLAQNGLPTTPMTTFGSKLGWKEYLSKRIDLPVIVKGRFGSHGRTVKLVNSREQLESMVKNYSAGNVLIQPVLSVSQWYRTIVVGNEYLGEMRHRQKDKYKNSKGENEKLIKFNSQKMNQLKEISLKAAKLFDCDYAGLDIGWDKERKDWVIFEINRTAQFKYFEKRTGVNVAKKIIQLHLTS